MKIFHVSPLHTRNDTRIFLKEAKSLAKIGHEVTFLVCDGKDDFTGDVSIKVIDRKKGFFFRILSTHLKLLKFILASDADIVHLHDPELIFLGIILRLRNRNVVYDMHEDFPKQIKRKSYLPDIVRIPLSAFFTLVEYCTLPFFSGICCATNALYLKHARRIKNVYEVANYPILGELSNSPETTVYRDPFKICFVGGITKLRGVKELIQSLGIYPEEGIRLQLAGEFSTDKLKEELQSLPEWQYVDFLGFLDRKQTAQLMNSCIAGIVTFLPAPNHIEAQPNKMYEYMSAGLPVIASNFPLWRTIIEGSACGLCVDPTSPLEIANAILKLKRSPDMVKNMGDNGINAVNNFFNWDTQFENLLRVYHNVKR